ncbi:PIN-like domain-containing protein [Lentzea sp. NPDC058450]|uniref:PIN-like domain-containing protein n=1 Tax=Lentzea sp. NPDC058450 TaxID=3346505 RepID=UPI00365274AA
MTDDSDEPSLLTLYQAWIGSPAGGHTTAPEQFYRSALIVLDTNVLLDLYRYTPSARDQVLAALELVSARLWLPYQVGLEFVRGRPKVIKDRVDDLKHAGTRVQNHLESAWKNVSAAVKEVSQLLDQYAADEEGQSELSTLINRNRFQDMMNSWKRELLGRVTDLTDAQDIALSTLASGSDSVLPRVSKLFGDRLGAQPHPSRVRELVDEAITYRYPNEIPPGFKDTRKNNATDLQIAGDFLLWDEMVSHAATLAQPRLVLLVSRDTKEDWYQTGVPGQPDRPWPSLLDEMQIRADAALFITHPKDFYNGIRDYLQADINTKTAEEISRAADQDIELTALTYDPVFNQDAPARQPPAGLALEAYRATPLVSTVIREALEDPTHRPFQWWLIGLTANLGLRTQREDEPPVDISAAVISSLPPAPDWRPGSELPLGEWPFRSTSWVAPWFAQMVKTTPTADRVTLLRLAVRQLKRQTGESEGKTQDNVP